MTLDTLPKADTPGRATSSSGGSHGEAKPQGVGRLPARLAIAGLGLVLVGMSGMPAIVLCGLMLALIGLFATRLSTDLAVPAAAFLLLAAAIAAGQLAHVLRVDLASSPSLLGTALVAIAMCCVLVTLRSRSSARTDWTVPPESLRLRWVAYLPAGLAVLVGLLQLSSPRLPATWAFIGTDFAQHLLAIGDLQRGSVLDYSADPYPRGLHMLLALVSGPGLEGSRTPAALLLNIQLLASVTWLSCGLVLFIAAALVLRAGALVGMPPGVRVLAAAVTGLIPLLHNDFVAVFVFMGAASSLLALAVLLALPLAAVAAAPRMRSLLPGLFLIALSTALLAHLWQALVVVPAATFLFGLAHRSAWTQVRSVVVRSRWSVLGLALGCAALATPPLVGVLTAGGLEIAAIEGSLPSLPMPVLAAVLVAATGLVRWWAHAWARLTLGVVAGLLLMTAIMVLGAGSGTDLEQYYPLKSLWFLWTFLTPLLGTWAVLLVVTAVRTAHVMTGRFGGRAAVVRACVLASTVALLFAFVLPVLLASATLVREAATGSIPEIHSARRLMLAIEHGTAHHPAVTVPIATATTPLPDAHASQTVAKLMAFQTGYPYGLGRPGALCDDVASVAGDRPAVVITDLDPAVIAGLADAQGCEDVRVVHTPGGSESGIDLMERLLELQDGPGVTWGQGASD
jgi:hypothetical protein